MFFLNCSVQLLSSLWVQIGSGLSMKMRHFNPALKKFAGGYTGFTSVRPSFCPSVRLSFRSFVTPFRQRYFHSRLR